MANSLGIRYGSAYHNGMIANSFAQRTGFGSDSSGGPFFNHPNYAGIGAPGRLFVAPSRYTGVRKVVFWATFRHEQTGGSLGINLRLRVSPISSSSFARSITSLVISQASFQVTFGTGSVISSTPPEDQACLYPWNGQGNSFTPTQYSAFNNNGAQLLYVEFDRFEAGSSDFFNDWDGIAAVGNDDLYTGYWLSIERVDGGIWNTNPTSPHNAPIFIGSGMNVVQAPQPINKTCMYVPATCGLSFAGAIGTVMGANRPWGFPYHADQWDGDLSMFLIHRQDNFVGAPTLCGRYTFQIVSRPGGDLTEHIRHEASVTTGDATAREYLGRSVDWISAILDGDFLGTRMRSDTGIVQKLPWAHFEIVVQNFNRCVVFFPAGMGTDIAAAQMQPNPPAPPPAVFGKDEALFDVDWFANLPDENILSGKVYGGLLHIDAGNDSGQDIAVNADLSSDVSSSLITVIVLPDLSSTPNATVAFKLDDHDIQANNVINFAGKRKLKSRWTGTQWLSGADDAPGNMGLLYALFVPNSEFLERGPVFDTGAFNPEGCAATSAGLGDPGVLVITNGSAIPQKFNPTAVGTDAEIEDAGIPPPFEDELPSFVVDDTAASPDGGLSLGTYRYRYTFRNCCTGKESDPNPDDIIVDTTGASPAAKVTFSFPGVRIPADDQICEICLYRTLLNGDFPVMAKVGCFNIEETDIFVDDASDASLDFETESLSLLNGPMPCVPIVVDFRNRLFGMGDIPNRTPAGTVSVQEGSDIIVGDGEVEWNRCLEGKYIQIEGDCRKYEILRVLPPEAGVSPPIGRLKLVDQYEGVDGTGLEYTICGKPNRLYGSEPFEPEYWPAANFLDIEPGDGDRLMGAVSNFDSLVICKRRKTYVLRFTENPFLEVAAPSRISSDIGCIGPRTFAQVESGSVWLADRGIAIFDGRTVQHLEESNMMNDMFINEENPRYVRRDINGRVIDAVGVFYPKRQQYLLLVPTVRTTRGCDVMIVWDTNIRNITVLEFCQEFQSMVVAKDDEGNERVYLGDTNGFVWIFDVGFTDGAGLPNNTGTLRGTVTAAGIDSDSGAGFIDDSSANFIEGGLPGLADLSGIPGLSGAVEAGDLGLAGVCVHTRPAGSAYDDLWTVRTIFAATPTRLFITPPWGADVPAVGDEYMIGAIDMDITFKPTNYGSDDFLKRDWRQVLTHEVEDYASELRVDLLPDFSFGDPESDTVVNDDKDPDTGDGRIFKMDYPKGRQVRPVGRLIHNFMGVRMRNFAPEAPVRILQHSLMVAVRESR